MIGCLAKCHSRPSEATVRTPRGQALVFVPGGDRATPPGPSEIVGQLLDAKLAFANAIVIAQRAGMTDEEIAHVCGYRVPMIHAVLRNPWRGPLHPSPTC